MSFDLSDLDNFEKKFESKKVKTINYKNQYLEALENYDKVEKQNNPEPTLQDFKNIQEENLKVLEALKGNNKEELEELNTGLNNENQETIDESIEETKEVIQTLETSIESTNESTNEDTEEENPDTEEKFEYKIIDFKTSLSESDLTEDIELMFNLNKFEWNNFESIIKKTKSTNNTFLAVVINYNGLYLISYLDFIEDFRAFNFIALERTKFIEFNYESEVPILLNVNNSDFIDLIQVVKGKSKDTEKELPVSLRIPKNDPTRLHLRIGYKHQKNTSYSIPFHMTDLQTNSFQYKLIDTICNTNDSE